MISSQQSTVKLSVKFRESFSKSPFGVEVFTAASFIIFLASIESFPLLMLAASSFHNQVSHNKVIGLMFNSLVMLNK